MINKRFGMLRVISFARIMPNRASAWNVICDCGSKRVVRGSDLNQGKTQSCGCLRSAKSKELINYIHEKEELNANK